MDKKTTKAVIEQMNAQLASELEAVNRYLHHSFMVFGFSRKPIVSYFRAQATESFDHATILGEKIVALGGHPQVQVSARWEPEHHSVREMLEINLRAEEEALAGYYELLKLVPADDVGLEEMVRGFIKAETDHIDELKKYLHSPEA
jgi:bacterioferritin